MTTRDRRALWLGIVLSVVGAALTAASVYAAGITFIIFSVLLPLAVSLSADNKIMSLSLATNLLMAFFCLIIFSILVVFSPSLIGRYGVPEIAIGIAVFLVTALVPALIVSGLVKVIRRKKA
jgi:hypothetical protein